LVSNELARAHSQPQRDIVQDMPQLVPILVALQGQPVPWIYGDDLYGDRLILCEHCIITPRAFRVCAPGAMLYVRQIFSYLDLEARYISKTEGPSGRARHRL